MWVRARLAWFWVLLAWAVVFSAVLAAELAGWHYTGRVALDRLP